MSSEQIDERLLLDLVATFGKADRPDLVMLTGGEPLLRPRLVRQLAERAHAVGSSVCLISGMFFARGARVPRAIDEALGSVDHFTASLDAFHEREVPRAAVFEELRRLLGRGQDVSLQVTALGADDPYLANLIEDAVEQLDGRVPIAVSFVGRTGRAREWIPPVANDTPAAPAANPCAMAAWPVVSWDGTVVACCNQTAVDGPRPSHLTLGRLPDDGWPQLRDRLLKRQSLRAIRVFGPQLLSARARARSGCSGYCESCLDLEEDDSLRAAAAELMKPPTARWLEQQVTAIGPESHFDAAHLDHLLQLGHADAAG